VAGTVKVPVEAVGYVQVETPPEVDSTPEDPQGVTASASARGAGTTRIPPIDATVMSR